MVFRAKNCQPYTFNFHGQIRIGTGHVFQPAWTMTSSTSALSGPTYVGSVSGICAFQILNKLITQFPCGWFQNWLHEICLSIPFRTKSAKYQPIWTDLGTQSAIFAFLSLNKLGPLVADFKIGQMNSVYTLQDWLSQIWAHLDWFGSSKCYFSVSVTK